MRPPGLEHKRAILGAANLETMSGRTLEREHALDGSLAVLLLRQFEPPAAVPDATGEERQVADHIGRQPPIEPLLPGLETR